MNQEKLSLLVQVANLAAVIGGILLILVQLNQNAELTRLQLITQIGINEQQIEQQIIGEEFSQTLAKVQSGSRDLTDEEIYQFDAFAFARHANHSLRKSLYEQGILHSDWREPVHSNACFQFDSPLGRAYVRWMGGFNESSSGVARELAKGLDKCPPSFMHQIRKYIEEDSS